MAKSTSGDPGLAAVGTMGDLVAPPQVEGSFQSPTGYNRMHTFW